MEIKGTGFAYNVTTNGHSNSDWGAEIGQGEKKLMNAPGASEILTGMLYYKVDEGRVSAILGRGNRTSKPLPDYLPDTSIVLASVVTKVSVNGTLLPGISFIMFVTKDERQINNAGAQNVHYQRRYLKFSDNATYDGNALNAQCIQAITRQLGCQQNGSWITTDMNFENDVLALRAVVVDPNNPHDFVDNVDRNNTIRRLKFAAFQNAFKSSSYSGALTPVILFGPPGTGKTYSMQQDYVSKFSEENRFVTTFHQSFSYEEFVEGLKPVLEESGDEDGDIKYRVEPGVFKKACERAVQMAGYSSISECVKDTEANRKTAFVRAISDKKLVLLCVDEINRGNVASIFGELISLIEDDKRLGADKEMMVTLPYSQDMFGVPSNLLIVGTMNTADRSIQLLDSALRRRFVFMEFVPTPEKLSYNIARDLLKALNKRIRGVADKDHQIGHAYFWKATNEFELFVAMRDKVIPLLQEYFYNDTDKIRFVLNEIKPGNHYFFVQDPDATAALKSYNADVEDVNLFMLSEKLSKIDQNTFNSEYISHIL